MRHAWCCTPRSSAGIDLVCDGELYRFDVNHPETNGMIEYFVRPLGGVRTALSFQEIQHFRGQEGMGFRSKPAGIVEAPVDGGTLDLPAACDRAKSLASRPLKFTLTGPHMLAKTLSDEHYGSKQALAIAIAEALAQQVAHLGAEVVQIDEANLPGHPDEWEWAAEAANIVLSAVKTTPAIHLCFGNYGGQSVQRGTWDRLIDFLNALKVDHIVMEMAHRPPEELVAFKALRPEIGIGLGVVDIKRTEVESADEIARSIERAGSVLGEGRVSYVHPDCGFWMLKRGIADRKIRALVEGRDLYEGRARSRSA